MVRNQATPNRASGASRANGDEKRSKIVARLIRSDQPIRSTDPKDGDQISPLFFSSCEMQECSSFSPTSPPKYSFNFCLAVFLFAHRFNAHLSPFASPISRCNAARIVRAARPNSARNGNTQLPFILRNPWRVASPIPNYPSLSRATKTAN